MTNQSNSEQTQLTKESLFNALMQLMTFTDLNDLSISAVTRKAGVSRMAFYRHYNILEDLISEHLNDIMADYQARLTKDKINNYELSYTFFVCFRPHLQFILNLQRSRLTGMLFDKLVSFVVSFSESIVCVEECPGKVTDYNIRFVVGGFFSTLLAWSQTGMKESAEQMAMLVSAELAKHISGIVN
ncbi:TetR/AcrR family transcriptional regulator [Loigolactobacillus backii]|uniref:Uncharacterized protein n=1 Tax=Loigolactobacillus backii TaxID=375175 RepID=A0A192H3Y4_9LACO|nr:TetR/AcrR family transcriptional regulator [Loigolactobacillus backii]ANK62963.1 hypothetical protein AYR53_09430 [Loigolactobacillus backii]ANK70029.1 hypothetical protein AYR56_07575 [Loigolactobacillus backii]MDA5387009.1 TetR/AcrR family transcriptional regulator [Loigolactobacillus backii]MDA5389547.1 TetR/AcrR family transcriptional regulator [Loigolactobacillus backii]PIO83386.1 hypothetical protein BSQ39_07370 [Loigolactobacillus backii]